MRAIGRRAVVVIISALSLAPRASAQTIRAWEIAAGYQKLDDPQDRVTLHGWTAGASVRLTPWLAAIAETGSAATTVFEIEFRQFNLLGGARAAARIGPFTEFVQLTAGLARSGTTVVGERTAENRFALQPGGGVDVPLGRHSPFALRLQIDRRSILGGEFIADDRHTVRLAAAIVYAPRR